LLYRVMGPAAAYKKDLDGDGVKEKFYRENGNAGDYGRLQVEGNVPITERDSLYFRIRSQQEIGLSDKDPGITDSAQYRVRFSHKHDFLNGATSRLHYQYKQDYFGWAPGAHNLEYQLRIPVPVGFDNDFIKTTTFIIAPKVGYSWDFSNDYTDTLATKVTEKHDSAATYYGGLDIYTSNALPLNFWIEANVYAGYYSTNHKYYGFDKDQYNKFWGAANTPIGDSKTDFRVGVELYLKNKTKLADLGDTATLSFYFEGGFDPYSFSSEKSYVDFWGTGNSLAYSLYALPALQLDWQPTDNVSAWLLAGAELRNHGSFKYNSGTDAKGDKVYDTFSADAKSTAQGWTWAPVVEAGFKVTF